MVQLELDKLGCRLRPAGVPGKHDTHRLHAMAPGLVGQTVERAGTYKGCNHLSRRPANPNTGDVWISQSRQP